MDVDTYRELALALEPAGFAAQFPHGFLVHKPSASAAPLLDEGTEQYDDRTGVIRAAVFAADESWEELDAPLDESELCVVPIVPRISGPKSSTITVGRTRLSDVVLRYEAVSKQHAQFVVGPQGVTHVRDLRSTHGSFVNGQRVPPDEQRAVRVRDHLSFGAVDFEWLDAEATRELLRAK